MEIEKLGHKEEELAMSLSKLKETEEESLKILAELSKDNHPDTTAKIKVSLDVSAKEYNII